MRITNPGQLGQQLQEIIDQKKDLPELMAQAGNLLVELASGTQWFREFLESKLFDNEFLISQANSIWPNEIRLCRSPDRSFSVSAYIWKPHAVDNIHDHGSWGVVTAFIQPFCERKFRRLDDGRTEGFAELEEASCKKIGPGDSTYVLPLDEGIHRIENTADNYVLSLSVYGRPVRRGYVQFFDANNRRVWRAFPPLADKQVMALRALGAIAEPWAGELLAGALRKDLPDFLIDECMSSLRNRRRR